MSVLKDKRTTSKAEYVNVANQIYVKTVDFLSRVSPRYSRLIAADTAHLAGQVMDHAEEANKIYPSDQLRKDLRKSHHLEAMAHLSALDVRLSHCYQILYCNPQGAFTDGKGHKVPAAEAMRRLDNMSQDLGDLINQETDLLKGVMESDKKREWGIYGCISEHVPCGRAAGGGGQCVVPVRQCVEQQQFLPCQYGRHGQQQQRRQFKGRGPRIL